MMLGFGCSKTPDYMNKISTQTQQNQDGTDPSQTGTDSPTPGIMDSAEFKESIKKLKSAEYKLKEAGHILPEGLIDLGVKELNWIDHKVEIEVGPKQYKKIKWIPGYVVSHHRTFLPDLNYWVDPVFKFIDIESFKDIESKMNSYLDTAESFYKSYKGDIGESDKKLLELQFDLVESTLISYDNHVADLIERQKIKTMTWGEIVGKWSLSDVVLIDKSLDLLYISGLVLDDNQELLGPLVKEKKVKSLTNDDRDLSPVTQNFKVYENYLIYIK